MKHSRHTQNLIALVRIRPVVDWSVYTLSVGTTLLSLICMISVFLTMLQYGLLAFIYPHLLSRATQFYVAGAIGLIFAGIYTGIQTRRHWRELRGLWWFFHATETKEAKNFSWNTFLKISLPMWLIAEEILPDPSPAFVLEEILGPSLTIEEAQALYQTSPEREAVPTLSIKISLANTISISIIGEDGKQETFNLLRGSNRPALIAFLALHARGEWILRDVLLKQVYGSLTKGGLFLKDIERLQKEINERLQQSGFLDTSEDTLAEDVKIFEHQSQGNASYWRLSPLCEMDECSKFNALYQNITALDEEEALNNTSLSREELHNTCHDLMTNIGKGFLSEYQEEETLWPWIEERYLTYRQKCLTVLEYAAKTEASQAQGQTSSEIQKEAMTYATKYYRWMVLVSCEAFPDVPRGREALVCCLKLYRIMKNKPSAKTIFRTYAQKMRPLDNTWVPDHDLLESWPEVIPPLWKKIQQEPPDGQDA